MREWVNVKTALPARYDYVLVCGLKEGTEPQPISIGRHDGVHWNMLNYSTQCNAVASGDLTWYMDETEITHWMPLPKVPKE